MSAAVASRPGALGVDALRELVNIGSGRALTTLVQLCGGAKVTMSVPAYHARAGVNRLVRDGEPGVMVHLSVGGQVPCTFFLLFNERAARGFAGRMLQRGEAAGSIGALEESALLELGNIMSCAFLDAIATMVRVPLMPGPPVARYGGLSELLRAEVEASPDAVAVSTRFLVDKTRVSGRLLLLTSGAAVHRLTEQLGISPGT